jgi:hypothetical protein
MNKIFKILYICTFILYTNICYAADMAGYLLDQAIKHYNDKNYGEAYTALNNIAPTSEKISSHRSNPMWQPAWPMWRQITSRGILG